MKKLLTVKDIQERYGVHENTALKYIHQMRHMREPLRTWEDAVEEWEQSRTVYPEEKKVRAKAMKGAGWVRGMKIPKEREEVKAW